MPKENVVVTGQPTVYVSPMTISCERGEGDFCGARPPCLRLVSTSDATTFFT
jgi:hypothetical protein